MMAARAKRVDDSHKDSAVSRDQSKPLSRKEQVARDAKRRAGMRAQVRRDYGIGWEISSTRNITKPDIALSDILKAFKLEDGIEEEKLAGAWKDIVGDFIGQHTKPVSLKKGYLRLQVLQPSMRFHLEQEKGRILAKLQAELGKNKVRVVQFVLG